MKHKITLASATLIAFIAGYEGLRTQAYLDPVGIPTICYGSTRGVELGQRATKAQCDQLLKNEAGEFGEAVLKLVKVPINQNQFDALTSFAFNVGIGAFSKSTLLKKLNAGDYYGAANQFNRWTYSKGRKLPGLVTRRAAERKLFLTPVENLESQTV
jgi:lysozyme